MEAKVMQGYDSQISCRNTLSWLNYIILPRITWNCFVTPREKLHRSLHNCTNAFNLLFTWWLVASCTLTQTPKQLLRTLHSVTYISSALRNSQSVLFFFPLFFPQKTFITRCFCLYIYYLPKMQYVCLQMV